MNIFTKSLTILALVVSGTGAQAACNDASSATIAASIAHGHAFVKHSAEFVHGAVIDGLPFPDPTIGDADAFGTFIHGILDAPTASKGLVNDRSAYWATPTGTVVIVNLNVDDCGTAFRPNSGMEYYDNLQ